MIFNIPLQTSLVSTDVEYRVALFDDLTDYEDGTKVRVDDTIYTTRREAITYPAFDENVDYKIGDKASAAGKDFEKVYESIAQECIPGSALPRTYDLERVVEWDGGSKTANLYVAPSVLCPEIDKTFTFTANTANDGVLFKSFDVVITNNLTSTDEPTARYDLYSSIYTAIIGGYAIYRGWLVKVNVNYNSSLSNLLMWNELEDGFGITYKISLDYYNTSIKAAPFDLKQYSSVVESGNQSWVVKSDKKFDGIALGYLRGETVTVIFKNSGGIVISTIEDKKINSRINDNLDDERTSEIIYSNFFIEENGTVEIIIKGAETEVGMIFATASVDVGLTNLKFSHDIKSFDREEVSAISGFVDRIRGNRVVYYKGSFDIEMTSYDKMLLINKKLTNELVAVDGSDMKDNLDADGEGTFSSTKLICSINQLKTASEVKDGELEQVVPINFEFREIV